ncbi:reverse transcriptase [Corchorus capsularis]|uniref:Reverse transcriptase n=1 Tax=Corchorus capsularis TaxID=210143 RepID=A0A1R3IFI1_COCAP|nr:reverse transcriptase [Corchorus capsularis]
MTTPVEEVLKQSFRDKVRGVSRAKTFDEEDRFGALDMNDGLIEISTKDSWPAIRTTPKLREFLHKKWRNCLIVKLLGRNIGFKTLENKVMGLWKPMGDLELIELGEGYFIAKFYLEDDMKFALEEGPWVIFGHYLTVSRWRPDFRPSEAAIHTTAAWIRFPELPVEFYDERFLLALGNTVGKEIKVDRNTHFASRGKFARVCVEVDLTKPLVPKVYVDDRWTRVEYEGLPLICFQCGYVGHRNCKIDVVSAETVNVPGETGNGEKPAKGDTTAVVEAHVQVEGSVMDGVEAPRDKAVESAYGPWMVAQPRRQRGPTKKMADPTWKQHGTNDGNTGSRFAALANLQESENGAPITGSGSKSTSNFVKESRPIISGSTSRYKVHGSTGRPRQEPKSSGVLAPKNLVHEEVGAIPAFLNKFSEKSREVMKENSLSVVDTDSNLMVIDESLLREEEAVGVIKAGNQQTFPSLSSDHRTRDPLTLNHLRGAGSKAFRRNSREFLWLYRPHIFIVVEPRISGDRANRVAKRLGFSDYHIVDPVGFSGGLWICWDSQYVQLEILFSSTQVIHVIVRVGDEQEWLLSAVYASPVLAVRRKLWEAMEEFTSVVRIPRMMIGDFNDISTSAEKFGGADVTINRCMRFNSMVANCGLSDLGFQGPSYTWTNRRKKGQRIHERLDRALASAEWRLLFPEAIVKHLPRFYSDHCPILVQCKEEIPIDSSKKPFRFQAMWLTHKEGPDYIANCWGNAEGDLMAKSASLVEALKTWNKEVFGNIFERKKELRARVLGVQKALARSASPRLIDLEQELVSEYNKILEQEELLWFQKSRVQWYKEGEKNTKLFHLSTVCRRRRNKISMLKNDDGEWVLTPASLKAMVSAYYVSLFSVDNALSLARLDVVCPVLPTDRIQSLDNGITITEVKQALFQMKPWKAPGNDGFHAVLWNGEKLNSFQPQRGLRQGDPLSPYLFVLCMERLGHLIDREAIKIKEALDEFCMASGAKISFDKSKIFVSPKAQGGNRRMSSLLGIPSTDDLGKYLGVPLIHGRVTKATFKDVVEKSLGRFLKAKYRVGEDIWNFIEDRQHGSQTWSYTWRSLIKACTLLSNGLKWRIGNGSRVKFWADPWLLSTPLRDVVDHSCYAGSSGVLVLDYMTDGGGWNMEKIFLELPMELALKVIGYPLPNVSSPQDRKIWKFSPNGIFTTKSAYQSLIEDDMVPLGGDWSWFWKIPLPARWLHFIWLVRRGRLLTNSLRATWGMGNDPKCHLCGLEEESLVHILRDCPTSRKVWDYFGKPLNSDSLMQWLDDNLALRTLHDRVEWRIIFGVTLWRIWTRRCGFVMNEGDVSLDESSLTANIMVTAGEVMKSLVNHKPLLSQDLQVRWVPPEDAVVKLNTDGAAKGNPGVAGAGGVIRSAVGSWLMGFKLHLGVCSNVEAELQAIRQGLLVAWNCSYRDIICETDALIAIDLIKNGDAKFHPLGYLLIDIRQLLHREWRCKLQHTYREGNFCADWLANAACELDDNFELLPAPPDEVKSILNADTTGVFYPRGYCYK